MRPVSSRFPQKWPICLWGEGRSSRWRTFEEGPRHRHRVAVALLLVGWTVSLGAQSPGPPAAAQPQAQLPSFPSLILDLAGDVRHLPSLQNVVVLGSAGAVSLGLSAKDADITRNVTDRLGDDAVFDVGAVAGQLGVQAGGAMAVFVVGRVVEHRAVAVLGSDLVRAQILNAIVTAGIKEAAGRQRPNGGRLSFPSGHASATFATAAVLQRHLGWRVGVPAYALATFTGLSRVAQNKHYPSDVVFGAALGAVIGRTASVEVMGTRAVVQPALLPGGLGVSLVLRRVS